MRPLFFLFLLLLVSYARAQNPLVLPAKLHSAQLDLTPYTFYYQDFSGKTLPLAVIKTKPFRPLAQRVDHAEVKTWLRFTLRNTHPEGTLKLFLLIGQSQGQITKVHDKYKKIDVSESDPFQSWTKPGRFTVNPWRPPGTENNYWVLIKSSVGGAPYVSPTVMAVEADWKEYLQQTRDLLPILILMSALSGCVMFMGAYALYHYHLTRDMAFLYYGLYAVFGLFNIIKAIDSLFNIGALIHFHPSVMIKYPFSYSLILIFYALFLNQLLQIHTFLPRLWRIALLLLLTITLEQGITLVETVGSWSLPYQFILNWTGLMSSGLLLLVLLLAIIRSRSPIRSYLLAGNGLLLGLTGLLFIFPYFQNNVPSEHLVYILNLMGTVGFTGELFCFAMALAYRSRLSELEKQGMQQEYSQELEAKLAHQAEVLQQQSQELEIQHLRQLESEFERKLADTEMVALRAQMNPHFIFNCLNSIKLYTLQNNSEQASDYLSKFARLIRLVLENSRSELVPLRNELEALQLYSDLEAMRFKHKVRFSIQVSPGVDTQYLRIPPLLLQPYVENAIWHGLMPKPEGGTVRIQVHQPAENLLRIEIKDDGVGRAKAAELKSKSTGKHKSFGLQVTADRIRMINHLYKTDTQVQILDLVDSLGEPCGTKVVLEIPVN